MAKAPTRQEKARHEERVISGKRAAQATARRASRAYNVPEGIDRFDVEWNKTYEFDIMPFICRKRNKTCEVADAGEAAVVCIYFAHFVGPNNNMFCCPGQTFDCPCPVCQHRAELEKNPAATKDQKKALNSKCRELRLVRLKGENKIRYWDIAEYNFGRHLRAKIEREEKYHCYADFRHGFTLKVGTSKATMGSRDFPDCNDVQFLTRQPMNPDLLKKMPCMDDWLVNPDYNAMKAEFLGAVDLSDRKETAGGTTATLDFDNLPASNGEPAGIEIGSKVHHKKFGDCQVNEGAEGGKWVVEDEDGNTFTVREEDLELLAGPDADVASSPTDGGFDPDNIDSPGNGQASTYEVGDKCWHPDQGNCRITKVKDGTLTVVDSEGDIHKLEVAQAGPPRATK